MCAWSAVHAQNEAQDKHIRAVHKTRISAPDVVLKCKSCSPQRWHNQSQLWHKEGCTQCKMCTPAAQDYDECSAHRGNKAVHTCTLEKGYVRGKTIKKNATHAVHKNVAQTSVVRNACTCSTEPWSMQCRDDLLSSARPYNGKILKRENTKKKNSPTQVQPAPASLVVGRRPQKASRSESQCMGAGTHGPTGQRA